MKKMSILVMQCIIKGLTVWYDANGDFPRERLNEIWPTEVSGDYVHKTPILENFRIEANLTDTALFGTTRHARLKT